MSDNSTAEVSAPSRPATVDYAVYALIARCVLSLAASLALFGARDDVRTSLAETYQDKHWTAQQLHDNVDSWLRQQLVTAVVMIVVVAVLIKLIRDGRNWARWLYLAVAILLSRDVYRVAGFFVYHDFLARMLTGLVGLSAIAALALLFLPDSNTYFRPAGGQARGLFGGMFRPLGAGIRQPVAGGRPGVRPAGAPLTGEATGSGGATTATASDPVTETDSTTGAGADTAAGAGTARPPEGRSSGGAPASQPTSPRTPPRGKSRQAGQPRAGR